MVDKKYFFPEKRKGKIYADISKESPQLSRIVIIPVLTHHCLEAEGNYNTENLYGTREESFLNVCSIPICHGFYSFCHHPIS